MKRLSVKEAEYIAFKLAQEFLSSNEQVPDFSIRYPSILENCLTAPFQDFGVKSSCRGIIGKAAALFYLLIKNHPFHSSNKRVAVTALLVFLFKNKKWLKADTQELYNFTMWIVDSPPRFKIETVKAIEKFIRLHLARGEGSLWR